MDNKKRVAVITPGGDAPGMNACIRAVVRSALFEGYEVFGIQRGYGGLLENDITQMSARSVSGIIHHGGTILKSTRCEEIKKESAIKRASQILKKHGISDLVVIGGDGSIRAASRISKYGVSVVCIPASIDNDIYGTDETIGYDTALDTAVEAVDKIRDTATSFERIFIVEVMGREHGFLALDIALASGAEFVVIPEIKFDLKKLISEIKKEKLRQKTSVIIIFAEGAGNPHELSKSITAATGYEVRVSSLGYIQRGGVPSARTRILASKFARYAVGLIKAGKKNRLVGLKNNLITDISINEALSFQKHIDKDTYNLIMNLSK